MDTVEKDAMKLAELWDEKGIILGLGYYDGNLETINDANCYDYTPLEYWGEDQGLERMAASLTAKPACTVKKLIKARFERAINVGIISRIEEIVGHLGTLFDEDSCNILRYVKQLGDGKILDAYMWDTTDGKEALCVYLQERNEDNCIDSSTIILNRRAGYILPCPALGALLEDYDKALEKKTEEQRKEEAYRLTKLMKLI